ncbi:hypothetical protein LZ32DRAFT_71665 [Colletotrichum eremochloae]|nr:hypothetical protein LY78DRAFT_703089 [Colletotrichum sublineola]KAK2006871.1 hypothetical protein LZ32DRAFT_71665 [Colletotrichum eremochloae]
MHGMAWYRHSRDFWGFMGPRTGVLGATRRNLTSERAVQVHSLIRKTEREGTGRTYPRQHDEVQPRVAEGCQEETKDDCTRWGKDEPSRNSREWVPTARRRRRHNTSRNPLIWTSPIISNLVCT